MWILIWRIAMIVIALLILGLVVWYVAISARAAWRQTENVARQDRETEPDISDAEFEPAPDDDPAEDSSDGPADGE